MDPRLREVRIDRLEVGAFTVPAEAPLADGTFAWDRTTLVLVEVAGGGAHGLGYTYADAGTARLIHQVLAPRVIGLDALAVPRAWEVMRAAIRNLGRPGVASMAIAAVDCALWDLKARLLDVPLLSLWGAARPAAPVYGSGGFTSYPVAKLQAQLAEWVEAGIPRVKMKVGSVPEEDEARVRAARAAIGPAAALFVDANGAYARKQALWMAEAFAQPGADVTWFEEPVSSDDLEGLRLLRDRAPAALEISAGEYGYDLPYFTRLLDAGAVDVLQADATRCAGFTELFRVAALCAAHCIPLSTHCAPQLHAHLACALPQVRHLELFSEHARIERLLFEGALSPRDGALWPDLSRPGLGIELKRRDAEHYAV